MRAIRQRAPRHAEDVTSQAGWMYADLFLALMVIFLATISFVPRLMTPAPKGNSSTPTATVSAVNFDSGLAQLYTKFDLAKLREDINTFKEKHKLSQSSEVIYVQVIGGYAANESADIGTLAAIDFSVKMKSEAKDLFGNAAFKLDTSAGLPSRSVALRMTFAAKLG